MFQPSHAFLQANGNPFSRPLFTDTYDCSGFFAYPDPPTMSDCIWAVSQMPTGNDPVDLDIDIQGGYSWIHGTFSQGRLWALSKNPLELIYLLGTCAITLYKSGQSYREEVPSNLSRRFTEYGGLHKQQLYC